VSGAPGIPGTAPVSGPLKTTPVLWGLHRYGALLPNVKNTRSMPPSVRDCRHAGRSALGKPFGKSGQQVVLVPHCRWLKAAGFVFSRCPHGAAVVDPPRTRDRVLDSRCGWPAVVLLRREAVHADHLPARNHVVVDTNAEGEVPEPKRRLTGQSGRIPVEADRRVPIHPAIGKPAIWERDLHDRTRRGATLRHRTIVPDGRPDQPPTGRRRCVHGLQQVNGPIRRCFRQAVTSVSGCGQGCFGGAWGAILIARLQKCRSAVYAQCPYLLDHVFEFNYFSWCPRHDSNVRTRLRRPLLYPLSYGGSGRTKITSPESIVRPVLVRVAWRRPPTERGRVRPGHQMRRRCRAVR
jgi:hypothetical protein